MECLTISKHNKYHPRKLVKVRRNKTKPKQNFRHKLEKADAKVELFKNNGRTENDRLSSSSK